MSNNRLLPKLTIDVPAFYCFCLGKQTYYEEMGLLVCLVNNKHTLSGVMVSKLDEKTFMSEFESH